MEILNRRRRQRKDLCDCLEPVIRFWGLFTSIVICGTGTDITYHGFSAGIYILFGSLFVFFIEIKWIITLFVELLYASDHLSNCLQCWSYTRVIGGWRVSPFYCFFGITLIYWPHNLWVSYVAGVQLLILALLRFCTIYRSNAHSKDEGLLPQHDDAFDKSEVLSDGVDDSFPEFSQNIDDEDIIENSS